MRTLKFEDKAFFEIIHESFFTNRDGYNIQDSRYVAKTLDKMEEVGQVSEELRGIKLYTVKEGTTPEIDVDDAEFAIIRRNIEQGKWTGAVTRTIVKLVDWLDSLPSK